MNGSSGSRVKIGERLDRLAEDSADVDRLLGLSVAVVKTAPHPHRKRLLDQEPWLSEGGGIRTLERPVTSNGFRDRYEYADLQGCLFPCASLCASNSQVMHREGS
jgi:hypothetical protein